MKKTGLVVTILLLLGILLISCSGALAATDGIYNLVEISPAPAWDGTDANRLKASTTDYNYTYGDESSVTYTLPWSFSFYGQVYPAITADTNGNIWFSTSGSRPVISAWNNDLSSYYYGGVFIQYKNDIQGDRVVIEWRAETYTEEGYSQPNSFEVVLFRSGAIRINYGSFTTTAGVDLGSGIFNSDGTHYLNLTSIYHANVYALAGRSFSLGNSTTLPLTTNPVPSVTSSNSQTLSGTRIDGSIITVTSSSGVVGTVTYPTSTTWQCVISGLAAGDTTFTITTNVAGVSSAATVQITYIPPPIVSLSPSSIIADFKGALVLVIGSLSDTGAEVLVEQLVDANHNGVIDSGDYLIRTFKVTDGTASTNPNIPGDTDGAANKAVIVNLNYFLTSDIYHAPGNYLFRVTNGIGITVAQLIVSQVSHTQTISGTVNDGTNPIAGAMVKLNDKWHRTIAYTLADGSGNYFLNVKNPGDYLLSAIVYGRTTPSATAVTLAASANVTGKNLSLSTGAYHVTGHVKDSANSAGIAGIWVEAKDANGNSVAMAITGADGAYDLTLPAGKYAINVFSEPTGPNPYSKGYTSYTQPPINVDLSANLLNQDILLAKGTVSVSGSVLGSNVSGLAVKVKGWVANDSRELVSSGITDANGNYVVNITDLNNWSISLDDDVAQTTGYLGTSIKGTSVISGTPSNNDLTAHTINAWVKGTVSNKVPDMKVQIRNTDSTIMASVRIADDGKYLLGAYAGNWLVDGVTEKIGWSDVAEQNVLNLVGGETRTLDLLNRLHSDFNGDGKPDILWRNTAGGEVTVWYMNGITQTGITQVATVPAPWEIVGTPDMNGDGKPDLLWRSPASGEVAVWYMNGITLTGTAQIATIGAPWEIVGTPDMNGDGKPDILWRNPTTGEVTVWYMNGITQTGIIQIATIGAPWEIVGTPDMNGDGKPDILWRNPTTGEVTVWYMNGITWTGITQVATVPAPWEIIGTPDMNGDGKPDLLWRNPASGEVVVWYMNGITLTGTIQIATVPAPWEIEQSSMIVNNQDN